LATSQPSLEAADRWVGYGFRSDRSCGRLYLILLNCADSETGFQRQRDRIIPEPPWEGLQRSVRPKSRLWTAHPSFTLSVSSHLPGLLSQLHLLPLRSLTLSSISCRKLPATLTQSTDNECINTAAGSSSFHAGYHPIGSPLLMSLKGDQYQRLCARQTASLIR
jgi:hypothetical protein